MTASISPADIPFFCKYLLLYFICFILVKMTFNFKQDNIKCSFLYSTLIPLFIALPYLSLSLCDAFAKFQKIQKSCSKRWEFMRTEFQFMRQKWKKVVKFGSGFLLKLTGICRSVCHD